MGEYPVPRPPANSKRRPSVPAVDEAPATPEQQQSIAHGRHRICKVRDCEICAPLRERRRLQKAARKAEAQAQAHAKGQPCGRTNCSLDVCVESRRSTTAAPTGQRGGASGGDPAESLRRQQERHRAGLPCGSEVCPRELCKDGIAQERARRHRARRPCRFATCDNPICLAARSKA